MELSNDLSSSKHSWNAYHDLSSDECLTFLPTDLLLLGSSECWVSLLEKGFQVSIQPLEGTSDSNHFIGNVGWHFGQEVTLEGVPWYVDIVRCSIHMITLSLPLKWTTFTVPKSMYIHKPSPAPKASGHGDRLPTRLGIWPQDLGLPNK